ncbi:hypothetical protein E4U36_004396 [Claviceps purpurea]|nr:hypothetical protein E4U36_004396 [Claviceps purpurea]
MRQTTMNMNFFFSNSHHSTWLRDHSDQPVKQFHNQLHHPQRLSTPSVMKFHAIPIALPILSVSRLLDCGDG